MSLIAGSIQVELEALDKGFSKSFDNAYDNLKKFEKGADDSTKRISDLSNNLLSGLGDMAKGVGVAVGVGLAAFAGYGAKLAIDYEKQLSGIKALTGATADEMTQISKLAVKLGNDTKFSSIEAAKGAEELLKAGVSLEQVLSGGLAGALDLAAAGELEVADAAEIASTALNAFKRDGLSVSNAADILAGAANASATSVTELKFGLSQVASVASGVGLTFKDTSTALAVFAQNGLKGSDAGTSLKTMLLNLQPTTKAQRALFNELGLTVDDANNKFFTAEGKIKDLASISGVLKDSLKDMTDQQRLTTLEQLFGSDAIRAANILYKEGSEGIEKMTGDMTKFKAADVARERTNNLSGALERFKGTIDTKSIELFSTKLPNATSAIESLNTAIQNIDVAKIDEGLGNFFKWISDNYILVVSALTGIASVILTLMVPALYTSAVATWTLMAPLLPLIAVVFLVVAALTALVLFIDANMPFIQEIVKVSMDFITKTFGDAWNWITTTTSTFFAWISKASSDTWTSMTTFATDAWNGFVGFFVGIWDGITKTVSAVFLTIYGLFTGNQELLDQVWEKFWKGILVFLYDSAVKIRDKVNEFLEFAKQSFLSFVSSVVTNWNNFWQGVRNKTDETLKWIVEAAPKAWDSFIQGIKDFGSNLTKGSDEAMKGMGDRIWEAINWIKSLDMAQIGKDMIQGMINGIINMGNNLKNAVGDVVNNAVNSAKKNLGIQSPSKVFYEIGGYTMEGMQNGISENIDMPVNAINTATTATVNQSIDQVVTQEPKTQGNNYNVTINGNYLGSERDKRTLARDLKDAFDLVMTNKQA